MRSYLTESAEQLSQGGIRAFFDKAAAYKNTINLGIGEPAQHTPEAIIEAAVSAAQMGYTHYSANAGFLDVRHEVASYLKGFDLDYDPEGEIVITCGGMGALALVLSCTVDTGTGVLIQDPQWVNYSSQVRFLGGKVIHVEVEEEENYVLKAEQIRKSITDQTKILLINSPNNPSGVVYTKETLEKIGACLKKKEAEYGHPIYIIADEPYRELVYGDAKVTFIPEVYDNTIVCYSWSKSLSLPGERIGYVYVPAKCEDGKAVYAAVAGAAREIGSVCPPTLIQRVVQECVGCMPDLVAYDENRNDLYNGLTEMGYECAKPDGAFYLFMKAPNGDDFAFSEAAKLEENILIVPGSGFQCPGYLRLSYCVSNEMIKNSMPGFKRLIEKYGK